MKFKMTCKGKSFCSFLLFFLIYSSDLFSQISESDAKTFDVPLVFKNETDSSFIKPISLGFQARFGFASNTRIKTFEGQYKLNSRSQPTFSCGINYYLNASNKLSINTGVHVDFVKTLLFIRIPGTDLTSFYNESNGTLIEIKDVKFKVAIPLQVNFQIINKNKRNWNVSAGVNLNYSGFSSDELVIYGIADSNLRLKDVLHANVSSDNNKTIWPSYTISLFKGFRLANRNVFQVGFFGEYSNTDFLKTNYSIEIPNKPFTRGIALLNGSCYGIIIQYKLNRPNNRVVKFENK